MIDTSSIEQSNGYRAHHQNGGRSVPALPTFTFQDTGRTVGIRQKVSPYFGDKLRNRFTAEHPEPKPPVIFVPNDDQGNGIHEEDVTDPKYVAAHAKWLNDLGGFAFEETLKYIFAVCIDPGTIDEDAVDAHIAYAGNEDNEDKVTIYLKYICPGSRQDLAELAQFVATRSQPTQEQINEKVLSFRGQVPE